MDGICGAPPQAGPEPETGNAGYNGWRQDAYSEMFKTLDRYVIREILPPFILSVLIFTFILELPPIMEDLEKLVAKGVPWRTAGRILLLLMPQALGLTIPMGLLVGILIGLGRLSADRESVALLACGVSPYRLLRPIMSLALASAAVTMWVMIVAIPHSNQEFRQITFEILSKKVESDVQPRVFFDEFPNWVLYPRDEPEPGQPGWKDVLVAEIRQGNPPKLYMAAGGQLVLDRLNRRVTLLLTNGTSYTTTGTGETQVYRFRDQMAMSLDPETVFPPLDLPPGVNEKTIPELRKTIEEKRLAVLKDPKLNLSPHPEVMAIHAKFSIPMACLVFGLIALALGMSVARDGKFGGFVVGVGVIFSYYSDVPGGVGRQGTEDSGVNRRAGSRTLVMGPIGVIALIFGPRDGWADFPSVVRPLPSGSRNGERTSEAAVDAAPGEATSPAAPARRGVVVVRFPRLRASPPAAARSLHQPHLPAGRRASLPRLGGSLLHLDVHRQVGQGFQGPDASETVHDAARLHDAAVRLLHHPDRRAVERARHVRTARAEQRADGHEGVRRQPLSRRRFRWCCSVRWDSASSCSAWSSESSRWPTARPRFSIRRFAAGRRARTAR